MQHRSIAPLGAIALALTFAGCGGGAGSATAVPPANTNNSSATAGAQTVAVTFRIVVPAAASAHTRRAQYISAATARANVTVNGGSAQSGSCTSASCTVTVNAPVGSDAFAVQLLDGDGNVLSQGALTQTISGTAANTVTLAFDGVPATVTLSAAVTHFVPGTLASTSLIVAVVKDASGNVIVGSDPYADAAGNPNPILLTTSNATYSTFSTTSLTSPATSTSTLTYTGAESLAGTSLTIGASATAITPTPATIAIYAHHAILEYPLTDNHAPSAIAVGNDGNVWFGESSGGNIGYVTPQGAMTLVPIPSGGGVNGMTPGTDGRIWFTEENGKIGAVTTGTTGGTIIEYASGVIYPQEIVKGANGNLFYADFSGSGLVGQMATSGTYTLSSAVAGNPQMEGIALGSDNRVWITEPFGGTQQFVAMDTSFNPTYYNTVANAQMRGITLGPSNNLWFCDGTNGAGGNNKIGHIHDDGSNFTEYAVPTANGSCQEIIEGTDGNLYFTEIVGNKLGISTPSGSITEYAVPTAASLPEGITNGPDGNIWFTETGGSKIARYVL